MTFFAKSVMSDGDGSYLVAKNLPKGGQSVVATIYPTEVTNDGMKLDAWQVAHDLAAVLNGSAPLKQQDEK